MEEAGVLVCVGTHLQRGGDQGLWGVMALKGQGSTRGAAT